MTSPEASSLFEQAMERYQQGAAPADLIGSFVAITEQSPNQAAGWTCLAWLQLLAGVAWAPWGTWRLCARALHN